MDKHRLKKIFLRWEGFLLVLLAAEILIFGGINPRFLTPRVLLGSINDFMPICIISLFVTFVLITGGMDIQAGSIVGLTSISIGVLWNDVGMSIWLAGALGIPTVAIFGSTNPATTSPVGEKSVVIHRDVACSPCLKPACPTDFRCMELIGADEVCRAAQLLLEGKKP